MQYEQLLKGVIPNFPSPYPDELLYSVAARYIWLAQCTRDRALLKEIFGWSSVGVPVDFPTRLAALAAIYGPDSSWDAEAIINNCTMLPFYSPFIPPNRTAAIKEAMLSSGNRGLLIRAGIVGSGISRFSFMRYCPLCAAEERRTTGEAFWHRLPQLPGVHVCHKHNVFLEDASIPVPKGNRCQKLIAGEEMIPVASPRFLDPSTPAHSTLCRVASGAAFLAQLPIQATEPDSVRQLYLQRAMQLGYATATGCLNWRELIPDFRNRYSEELLRRLHCSLPSDAPKCRDHWIAAILQKSGDVQGPVRHLLLIDFFALTPAEFFKMEIDATVFGKGPWECKNPVCPNTGQAVIREIHLEQSAVHQAPKAILTCPACGQKTARVIVGGAVREWVLDYGPIWTSELKHLWLAPNLSVCAIAEALGVGVGTVGTHAMEAGLPLRERITVNALIKPPRVLKRPMRVKQQLPIKRAEWTALRCANPALSTTELIARAKGCYSYLYKHDRKWLNENCPASRRRPPPAQEKIDWCLRDRELKAELKTAVQELQLDTSKPQRITITAIGIKMGKLRMLQKSRSKLPLTSEALSWSIESMAHLGKRRIVWAARCFREEGSSFGREDLVQRAELSAIIAADPGVVETIAQELSDAEGSVCPGIFIENKTRGLGCAPLHGALLRVPFGSGEPEGPKGP